MRARRPGQRIRRRSRCPRCRGIAVQPEGGHSASAGGAEGDRQRAVQRAIRGQGCIALPHPIAQHPVVGEGQIRGGGCRHRGHRGGGGAVGKGGRQRERPAGQELAALIVRGEQDEASPSATGKFTAMVPGALRSAPSSEGATARAQNPVSLEVSQVPGALLSSRQAGHSASRRGR